MSNRQSPSSDQLEGDCFHLGKHRKKPSENVGYAFTNLNFIKAKHKQIINISKKILIFKSVILG